jgi:hypothetical protein
LEKNEEEKEQQISNLENRLNKFIIELASNKSKLDEQKEQSDVFVKEKQAELERSNKEKEELIAKLRTAESKPDNKEEVERLNGLISVKEEEKLSISSQLSELATQNKGLLTEIETLKASETASNQQIESLKREKDNIKTEKQKELSKLQSELEKNRKSLESERSSNEREILALKAKGSENCSDKVEELTAQLNAKIDAFESKDSELNETIKSLEYDLDNKNKMVEQLKLAEKHHKKMIINEGLKEEDHTGTPLPIISEQAYIESTHKPRRKISAPSGNTSITNIPTSNSNATSKIPDGKVDHIETKQDWIKNHPKEWTKTHPTQQLLRGAPPPPRPKRGGTKKQRKPKGSKKTRRKK